MNDQHALICAPVLPEFDRECGSRRLYDLVCFLQELGWAVTYVAQQAENGARYARNLRQRGVATYIGFDVQSERVIEASRFDLALLAFWHVAEQQIPLIRRLSPDTRILVDSIDLHFVRNVRGIFDAARRLPSSSGCDARTGSEFVRELNVYAAADGVLTVSQCEADLVNDWLGDRRLAHVVPLADDLPPSDVPLEERRGILFIGNFRHAPNVGAVEYLCKEVVPRLDPELLAAHPVYIVGNGLNDSVRRFAAGIEHVYLVGWVPSLLPYLHRSRLSVAPLQYGAGTKGKLVQALAAGTPSVATSIGAEGLDISNEDHLLVADDAEQFARSVERLLVDNELWQRLAGRGRDHMLARHGRAVVKSKLAAAVAAALQRLKPPLVSLSTSHSATPYAHVVQAIRNLVQEHTPPDVSILVVSKGDPDLLRFEGRQAAHFPQSDDGRYAGHHPADSAEAIAHLEILRTRGSQFLLFPNTAFWWLEHYAEFRRHLDQCHTPVWSDDACVIYRLTRATDTGTDDLTASCSGPRLIEHLRPAVVPGTRLPMAANGNHSPKRVLALGIYLANQANTVEDVVANLSGSSLHNVTQQWLALSGPPPSEAVAQVTARRIADKVPKFTLLNDLLAGENLSDFDYVLLFDDDIVLPERFLDRFIDLQTKLNFAIAQPARTNNSYIDHPIVGQQQGALARQTRFVEIGPVVSFHRSIFDMIFPFDLTSPMGWGYENVWSYQLAQRGMKMGIIDAVPVDHSIRQPVTNYKWSDADTQRKRLFEKHPHYSYDECFRVLDVVPLEGAV